MLLQCLYRPWGPVLRNLHHQPHMLLLFLASIAVVEHLARPAVTSVSDRW